MAGEFIPFLSAAKSLPVAGSPSAPHFRPVASAAASGNTAFLAKQPGPIPGHAHGELKIELKRDGDRVSQIRIQCRCGEVIELDCEY